jgi:hypothetical protein
VKAVDRRTNDSSALRFNGPTQRVSKDCLSYTINTINPDA